MAQDNTRPERTQRHLYSRITAISSALDLKLKAGFEDMVQRIKDKHL